MGFFKKVFKSVGKIFGIDSDAARRAAEAQAAAAIAAAEKQAAAIKAASDSQVAMVNQQAQGTAMAQQHAANQANIAAKLRDQEQQNAQAPATRLETAPARADPDPRRKFRAAGGASIGGTAGGIGIRLT